MMAIVFGSGCSWLNVLPDLKKVLQNILPSFATPSILLRKFLKFLFPDYGFITAFMIYAYPVVE